jgi:hypothetical protein
MNPGITIEAVRISNLIHESEMVAVFAPPVLRALLYQRSNQPMCFVALLFLVAAENSTNDVMHLSHTCHGQLVKLPGHKGFIYRL